LNKVHNFCPFLGLADDSNTHMFFPSDSNCCYHAKPVSAINIEQQQIFCLTEEYENCKVYNKKVLAALPEEFRASKSQFKKEKRFNWKILFRTLILITTLVVILQIPIIKGQLFKNILFKESPTLSPTFVVSTATFTPIPTHKMSIPIEEILPYEEKLFQATKTSMAQTMSPESTITLSPTLTSSPIPTLTVTPTMTATYTATPEPIVHELDALIGTDYQFVIHKAKSGENLNQYATLYNTSVEAILRVNYALNIPLWVDALVVIPVNFSDVSQMPYFQPYKVTSEGISVETLAQELATNLEDFIYYNGLSRGENLNSGDWLIVPRYQSANQ